uniref:Ig-like domain-containing protein n=2 Tax=Sus scrofa TaxID=9823 RepID=A0A4X1V2I0_PIG
MPLSSLLWLFLASVFSGSSVTQKVIQDQPVVPSQVGESVTLNCQCETSQSAYYLFWYKQPPSGEMIYLNLWDSSRQNTKDGHYSINFQKAQKSSSLTISALQLNDSAMYFCALWELTVPEAIGEAEQKPQSSIIESPSAIGLKLNSTPADPKQEIVMLWLLHLWFGSNI